MSRLVAQKPLTQHAMHLIPEEMAEDSDFYGYGYGLGKLREKIGRLPDQNDEFFLDVSIKVRGKVDLIIRYRLSDLYGIGFTIDARCENFFEVPIDHPDNDPLINGSVILPFTGSHSTLLPCEKEVGYGSLYNARGLLVGFASAYDVQSAKKKGHHFEQIWLTKAKEAFGTIVVHYAEALRFTVISQFIEDDFYCMPYSRYLGSWAGGWINNWSDSSKLLQYFEHIIKENSAQISKDRKDCYGFDEIKAVVCPLMTKEANRLGYPTNHSSWSALMFYLEQQIERLGLILCPKTGRCVRTIFELNRCVGIQKLRFRSCVNAFVHLNLINFFLFGVFMELN